MRKSLLQINGKGDTRRGIKYVNKKGRDIYFTSLKVVQINEIINKNGGTILEKEERFFSAK